MMRLSTTGLILLLLTAVLPGTGFSAGEEAAVTPISKVTVYPLAYGIRAGDDTPFGVCHSIPITVGGAPEGEIRIGIFEDKLSGASPMWRAAAWQASLTAAQLLDFNPQAMQATFTVEGKIDGPSAGALLTIGVLSAVLGDPLRDDVTMTGTINPDGMIGPVGGIPFKIEGAARAGKTTVLIPAHSRLELDPRTKEIVDLIGHGENIGVKVIPVNDIWTAYKIFTGKPLPRPEAKELPTVSPKMSKHVLKHIPRWNKLYKSAREKYVSWPDFGHPEYANQQLASADKINKQINSLLVEGQFAPAYWDAAWSAALAWVAHEVGRYHYSNNAYGRDAAVKLMFQDQWLEKEVDTTAAAIRFYRPLTFDQLSIYMEACNAFFTGLCYRSLANVIRENLPDDPDVAGVWIVAVAEQHVVCWLNMKLARDYLELADSYEGTPIPEGAPVNELSKFFLRSTEAGLSMVNELEVKKVAKKYKLNNDAAIAALSLSDPAYAMAQLGMKQIIPSLPKYFGEGKQLEYARLAAAIGLHTRAAMLIAKYYSLGVELDDNYNFVRLKRERALEDWLDDSKDQAQRAITGLGDAGIDQTTCLQIFSIARIYEGRSATDRIEALGYYFTTNVLAQVLQRLAAGDHVPELDVPQPAPLPAPLPAPIPPPSEE
ncbi:Lon protease [Symmachiella dynata]|uniref:endopeptidase La n=1 Tax=Symmachiella dynata TaxID=2527995 RepID=A0A517ZGK1_9PLAN|nr:S16 family serine protease [Symmachiella dynata]QDU41579.1 Lon protease [Symmachiella dynata]